MNRDTLVAACREEPAGAPGGRPLGATPADGRTSDGRPLAFEANQGQTDSRVRFLQRGRNHALFLAPDEAVLELRRAEGRADVLRMRLLGSNVRLDPVGLDVLPGRSNYLIGNDPRGWRTGIPRYGRVKYENVYPGVDLTFHGRDGRLEYDLAVAPGVDPAIIRLGFQGAGRLRIDDRGNLILPFGRGEVVQRAPFLYQDLGGVRSVIPGKYLLKGRAEVGFAVDRAAYDPERPLVIDPILGYSTYFGGTGFDAGEAVAVDASGSAYVVGTTFSPNFPLANPRQSAMRGSGDVFVAKLDPSGGGLVYSTYLGGGNSDYGYGIAVDGAGSAYVTGGTYSTDFPMAGAFQPVKGGSTSSTDAFVTKLTPDGSALAYSSYLGGSEADGGGRRRRRRGRQGLCRGGDLLRRLPDRKGVPDLPEGWSVDRGRVRGDDRCRRELARLLHLHRRQLERRSHGRCGRSGRQRLRHGGHAVLGLSGDQPAGLDARQPAAGRLRPQA